MEEEIMEDNIIQSLSELQSLIKKESSIKEICKFLFHLK